MICDINTLIIVGNWLIAVGILGKLGLDWLRSRRMKRSALPPIEYRKQDEIREQASAYFEDRKVPEPTPMPFPEDMRDVASKALRVQKQREIDQAKKFEADRRKRIQTSIRFYADRGYTEMKFDFGSLAHEIDAYCNDEDISWLRGLGYQVKKGEFSKVHYTNSGRSFKQKYLGVNVSWKGTK